MPTLDFRVLRSKALKNSTFPIRLSVAHNGQTKYLKTDLIVENPSQLRNGTIVNCPDAVLKNLKLRNFLTKVQRIIDSMDYVCGLSCSELITLISRKLDAENQPERIHSVQSIFDEYISTARLSDRSITLSKECFKSLNEYLKKEYRLEAVNYATIMGYEKFLRLKGNSDSTIRTKMALFSKIIVYGRRCKYIPSDFRPFDDYTYPEPSVRDAWLTVEQIKILRDTKLIGQMANTTRDYIMLSYCLGGINTIDLLNINFSTLRKTNRLRYIRTKTAKQPKINKYIEFDVPDEAWTYIDKLIYPTGYICTKYQQKSGLHDYIAQSIKALRMQTGLSNLIYYSARKSFAQHAFTLGVPTGVIDFILGHKLNKGGSSLYNYICVTPEMATSAIRMVLDNLK